MSASSAACAVSCRGSASSSSRCAGHRERQDQPVGLGQGERAFGGLVRRALVTERTVGERGQQVGLDDRDVPDDRCRAIENIGQRVESSRPDRLRRGRSPRGHCGSRPSWPARRSSAARAARASPGIPRRAWVASIQPVTWLASACESASCDCRCSAALNSSSASWWRPRPAWSIPVARCSSSLMSGPVSVCRACSVRCSHRSPSSNSPVQTIVGGQRDQRGRDHRLRAPAVPLGERDRLAAAPPGRGERAEPRCETELRKAADFQVGPADPPGQGGALLEVAFSVWAAPGTTPRRSPDSSAPPRAGRCRARCLRRTAR